MNGSTSSLARTLSTSENVYAFAIAYDSHDHDPYITSRTNGDGFPEYLTAIDGAANAYTILGSQMLCDAESNPLIFDREMAISSSLEARTSPRPRWPLLHPPLAPGDGKSSSRVP